jgi:hypothetical protein
VILIIPNRRLWVDEEARRLEVGRTHTRFIRILKDSGLNVIDMRPSLEAGGNPLSNHFVNDGHWNESGHLLAAEALSKVAVSYESP